MEKRRGKLLPVLLQNETEMNETSSYENKLTF
jgi:hypothetical protein